jgi:hypothetical protein
MNALILQAQDAVTLLSHQHGQLQLMPLPLIDGTYFLLEEILFEPLYNGELDDIEYTIVPWSYVEPLLPPTPPEE